jgi:hypothetical protein
MTVHECGAEDAVMQQHMADEFEPSRLEEVRAEYIPLAPAHAPAHEFIGGTDRAGIVDANHPDAVHINDIGDVIDSGGRIDRLEEIFADAENYQPSESNGAASHDDVPRYSAMNESPIDGNLRIIPNSTPDGLGGYGRPRERPRDRMRVVRASSVPPEKVTWLWRYRLPRSKIVVFDGDPGLGKSTVLLDLAARVTRGDAMPDGAYLDKPGTVMLLSAEDGIGDTIVPRLHAAQADLANVLIATNIEQADQRTRPVTLPDDFDHLREMIGDHHVSLVIFDPLMAFLGGHVDSHKDQDIRRVLHQLKEIAEETNAATIICRHLTKSGGANPLYRGGGSIGIIGAARVAMLVAPDPDADGQPVAPSSGLISSGASPRRIIAVSKSNVGRIPPALAYHVEIDPDWDCSRIVWEGNTEHRACDLAVTIPADTAERGALREAQQFLREALSAGPRIGKDVEAEAEAYGIELRTLRRARERLNITPVKEKKANGKWVWVLSGTPEIERDHALFELDQAPSVGQVRSARSGEKGEDDQAKSNLTTHTRVVKFEDREASGGLSDGFEGWESGTI